MQRLQQQLLCAQRLPSLRKQLGDAKLQSLADVFELHAYEAGEVVAAAQKAGDRLFVIKAGCCILTKVRLRHSQRFV